MKINYDKIQQDAIAHYERMIAWAKAHINLTVNLTFNVFEMEKAIGERAHSRDCSYCNRFQDTCRYEGDFHIQPCSSCPLHNGKHDWATSSYCCNGLWLELNRSTSWKQWIVNAEAVLEYIKQYGNPNDNKNKS